MAANDVPCCETMFWVYLVICVALVAFAGLMSGLTLGLMSLSLVDLEVLIKAGRPEDRKNAGLFDLKALPIFVDALLPAWGAILISVTLILAFGEAGKGGELTYDETTIISGALDLTQKTAKDAMTSLYGVFSLDLNTKLDK
ncbi:protein of unknown function-containing protein [Forsythia ovata]|uniref:CNNM transmembrane domain-containing protein n=1 Tax=Forsythia ovata TaxID=205694 RepID=A0ABD1X2I1_9LAMI